MAAQGSTLRVDGYREFLTACDNAGRDIKREVRATFRKVGDTVKVDAAARMMSVDAKSAAGYRTYVRRRGVEVEQSLRKSSAVERRRPNFGGLQMRRALVPSLEANEENTVRAFEEAMDKVCDRFERTP